MDLPRHGWLYLPVPSHAAARPGVRVGVKRRGTTVLPEVHLIGGTRPEAVKLAPVAAAMRAAGRLQPVLVASGQHPTMVTQALEAFEQAPDVTLTVERASGSQPELLTEM